MVLEVDDGVYIETDEISLLRRNAFGEVYGVVGGTEFRITKLPFETALNWMQNKGRMRVALGY